MRRIYVLLTDKALLSYHAHSLLVLCFSSCPSSPRSLPAATDGTPLRAYAVQSDSHGPLRAALDLNSGMSRQNRTPPKRRRNHLRAGRVRLDQRQTAVLPTPTAGAAARNDAELLQIYRSQLPTSEPGHVHSTSLADSYNHGNVA